MTAINAPYTMPYTKQSNTVHSYTHAPHHTHNRMHAVYGTNFLGIR